MAGSNPIEPSLGRIANALARLAVELAWWVGAPGLLVVYIGRLVLFTVLLLPGFLPVLWHYLFAPSVLKNLPYSSSSLRHRLDVYLPATGHGFRSLRHPAPPNGHPVVVFVSGGVWIIGYKMWCLIMGYVLQLNGVLCISVDYRNFPQAAVPEMVDDLAAALLWVRANVERYGGDPNNVSLVGQSAGAHLSLLLLLRRRAVQEEAAKGESLREGVREGARPGGGEVVGPNAEPNAAPNAVRRWVGISGPYDVPALIPALHRRGLHRKVVQALMTGTPEEHSPLHALAALPEAAVAALPPATLYHGTEDSSVSVAHTQRLAQLLRSRGARQVTDWYGEGKTHTSPIIEDPLSGSDPLMELLLHLLLRDTDVPTSHAGVTSVTAGAVTVRRGDGPFCPSSCPARTLLPRYVPEWMLRLARWVNPF